MNDQTEIKIQNKVYKRNTIKYVDEYIDGSYNVIGINDDIIINLAGSEEDRNDLIRELGMGTSKFMTQNKTIVRDEGQLITLYSKYLHRVDEYVNPNLQYIEIPGETTYIKKHIAYIKGPFKHERSNCVMLKLKFINGKEFDEIYLSSFNEGHIVRAKIIKALNN